MKSTKVDAPGVYDIPIERYHGNVCVGPSISSSGLRRIIDASPAHYYAESYLNPQYVRRPSKALDFGKAAHALILQDGTFEDDFRVSPFDSFRTNEAKAWRDEQRDAGRTVITEDDLKTIVAMAEVLAENPVVKVGLMHGEREKSVIFKDAKTGVWVKTRPDVIPRDTMIADYKTCADGSFYAVQKATRDRGYYMQLALVREAMARVLGIDAKHFALVFQEKTPPYAVTVVELDADYVAWGQVRNRAALDRFAECLEKNEWPPYCPDPIKIGMPAWFVQKLTEAQEAGELPSFADVGITSTGEAP